MATSTPWGVAQTSERYVRGITAYTTASHGGFHVCPTLNAQVPVYMRIRDGWYEEDCDWAIVATMFPDAFRKHAPERAEKTLAAARDTLRNWRPEAYEYFYSVTLAPGESIVKDERAFYAAHALDWLAVSAFGDWSEGVPTGMVGVCARLGGRREGGLPPDRWFLVPATEYEASRKFAFVIEIERHTEIAALGGARKEVASA